MNWILLIIAGFFEVGWPLGLKLTQTMSSKIPGFIIAGISIILSGWLLWIAQKTIPIGTAYVVWTGIGAVGTLALGIIFFKDSTNILRLISASLIVIGIIGIRLAP